MSQRWLVFRLWIVCVALVSLRCGAGSYYLPPVMIPVRPGVDVLMERGFRPFQWKRAGLITNPTGIASLGKPTVDILKEAREIELVALFGPTNEALVGPRSPRSLVLRADVGCQRCYRRQFCKQNCINAIPVRSVINAINRVTL